MTLGGLALAVGILVDEATVEVENIHTQFEHTPNIATAVRLGNAQTAVPRLLAMLCILAVFMPSFFMEGSARALFVPLSLAVGFSMVTSYFLSSTFVPVMSVWLLRHVHPSPRRRRGSLLLCPLPRRLRAGPAGRHAPALVPDRRLRRGGRPADLAGGRRSGMDIFPRVDTGQFQLRLRAADGTRLEITEELAKQALEVINDEAGPDRWLSPWATWASSRPAIPSTRLPVDARARGGGPARGLKKGSHVRVEDLERRLRERLPERLGEWLRPRLLAEGLTADQVDQRVRALAFSFEPADIINEVMSFGSPTPVEVAVRGKD